MFCRRFVVLSSATKRKIGLAIATNSETTDTLVSRSESEWGSLYTRALLDFFPFVAGGLKTEKGMSSMKNVDSLKYVVNARGSSSL